MEVVAYFWNIIAGLQTIFGLITPFAFLYFLLRCISKAVKGAELREYKKEFIWAGIWLIFLLSPSIVSAAALQ